MRKILKPKVIALVYLLCVVCYCIYLYNIGYNNYVYKQETDISSDDYMQDATIGLYLQAVSPEFVNAGMDKDLFDNVPEPIFLGNEVYALMWPNGCKIQMKFDNGHFIGYTGPNVSKGWFTESH